MKLAYREYGPDNKTALIILHGLFGQSDNWNTLAKQFAERGYRVFSIDQRNHGLSPHSNEWSYELMASDLQEFIDNHHIEHPVLLGHSMGGKTVMFFDGIYPRIAKAVIICDIAPKAYPPHHQEVLKALLSVDFNMVKSRKEAEEALGVYITDFGTKQFLLKNLYWKNENNTELGWRFNLEVISDKYDAITQEVPLYKSSTPCLVVKGEKSNYIKKEDELLFKERYDNLHITEVSGAGHWVHAEKPQDFFNEVILFLDKLLHLSN